MTWRSGALAERTISCVNLSWEADAESVQMPSTQHRSTGISFKSTPLGHNFSLPAN